MLDLKKIDLPIQHQTESLPGIVRHEIYTLNDFEYTEVYDDLTGQFVSADVKMFGGISVCSVYPNGTISLKMPTGYVTNHKHMLEHLDDLKRLDEFLSIISEGYIQ